MAITASEPVCDIAGMRAVLPVAVSIGDKRFMAVGTGIRIKRFPVNLLRMGVPPGKSAFVRAEAFMAFSRSLNDHYSADWTEFRYRSVLFRSIAGEPSPSAPG